MTTALRIELRRGYGAYLLPVQIVGGLYIALNIVAQAGGDGWLQLTSAAANSVRMIGPLAAGAAAWIAARERRCGTACLSRLSARPSYAAAMAELAAVTFWAVVAYTAVWGLLAAQGLAGVAWGRPDLLWTAVGAAGIGVHTATGYVLGRLVPWRWTPVLSAIVWYSAGLVPGVGGAAGLLPAQVTTVSVFDATRPDFLLAHLAWCVGLTGVVVIGWTLTTSDRARLQIVGMAASTAVMITGMLAVVSHRDGPIAYNAQHFTYRCAGSAPAVCVHPAYRDTLPALVATAQRVQERVAGTPLRLRRIEQHDIPENLPQAGDITPVVAFAIYRRSRGYETEVAKQLGSVLIGNAATCDETSAPEAPHYVALIQAWVGGALAAVTPLNDLQRRSLRWFADLSEGERRIWLAQNFNRLKTCELTHTDFRSGS